MLHPHDLGSNLEPWTVRVTYLARELRALGHEVAIAYHALGVPGAPTCLDDTDILTVPLVRYSRTLIQKTKIVRRLAEWADLVHFQKCLAYTALPAVRAAYSLGLPLHYDWDDWESEIYNYRPPSRVVGRHIDRLEKALPVARRHRLGRQRGPARAVHRARFPARAHRQGAGRGGYGPFQSRRRRRRGQIAPRHRRSDRALRRPAARRPVSRAPARGLRHHSRRKIPRSPSWWLAAGTVSASSTRWRNGSGSATPSSSPVRCRTTRFRSTWRRGTWRSPASTTTPRRAARARSRSSSTSPWARPLSEPRWARPRRCSQEARA